MPVVTLTERKAREANRRTEAVRAIMDRLRTHVRETGNVGRFIIFGSAAADSIRHISDLDVIVDFPPDREAAAWTAVEDACADWNVPADVKSIHTTSRAFLEKIMSRPVKVLD